MLLHIDNIIGRNINASAKQTMSINTRKIYLNTVINVKCYSS